MNSKVVRIVAGLVLHLACTEAHAEGEGAGNPFPFQAPPQTAVVARYAADAGYERFPDLGGRLAVAPVPVRLLAVVGSEASVQSAASAPAGSDEGTVAFAQARGLERYEAARGPVVQPVRVVAASR